MFKLAFGQEVRWLDAAQDITDDTALCNCAMIVSR